MSARSTAVSLLAMLFLAAVPLAAQGGGGGRREGEPRRQGMEREVRQRFGQVVQRELALDEAQMKKLQATVNRFDEPKRELMRRENVTRRDLVMQLRMGDTVSQDRVEKLLEEMLAVQKRRIELHEQEDRELRTFLTPVQRAKFFGLQEQLRRRVEEVQKKRRPGGGGAPGFRPPPQ